MIAKLKKILLDIDYAFYGLCLCSFFSIIGAFIVYFNPQLYNTIDYKALFKWLYYNQSLSNFWLYLVIIIFAYLGLSAVFCIFYDIKRKNIFTFLFHLSFVIVLVAHLINASLSFKIPEYIIPLEKPKTISLPAPHSPLKVYLDKLDYEITKEGIPKNIKANIIYLENDKEKKGLISINNPLKIGSYYLVMKYIAPYLRSITFKLKSDDRLLIPVLTPESPFLIDDVVYEFVAHNEDMTMFKVVITEGEKKESMIWSLGQNVNIKGKNFTITQIIPDTIGSIIVDIVYDPSLSLIFLGSTLFVFSAVIRFFKKD